ncbi:MAG: sarcosine oxidase subunit gamma [Rhodobacteraceae bacterium]|nr:sarcosine oxidase subunit gamma [Paracoccaceae bacterium]
MADAPDFQGIARIRTEDSCGMIALRADPEAAGALAVIGSRLGLDMPGPLAAQVSGDTAILWMSPDEMLVICPAADVPGHLDALHKAMAGHHAMALDVSDMRMRFTVAGVHAREVLAKLCPLDMSPEGFTPGTMRRTHLGQVAAGIWIGADGAFNIVCFRSVGAYVFDLLKVAAQPGSEVHLFTHPAA